MNMKSEDETRPALHGELRPRLGPMHGASRVLCVRADGKVVVLKDCRGVYFNENVLEEIPPIQL